MTHFIDLNTISISINALTLSQPLGDLRKAAFFTHWFGEIVIHTELKVDRNPSNLDMRSGRSPRRLLIVHLDVSLYYWHVKPSVSARPLRLIRCSFNHMFGKDKQQSVQMHPMLPSLTSFSWFAEAAGKLAPTFCRVPSGWLRLVLLRCHQKAAHSSALLLAVLTSSSPHQPAAMNRMMKTSTESKPMLWSPHLLSVSVVAPSHWSVRKFTLYIFSMYYYILSLLHSHRLPRKTSIPVEAR